MRRSDLVGLLALLLLLGVISTCSCHKLDAVHASLVQEECQLDPADILEDQAPDPSCLHQSLPACGEPASFCLGMAPLQLRLEATQDKMSRVAAKLLACSAVMRTWRAREAPSNRSHEEEAVDVHGSMLLALLSFSRCAANGWPPTIFAPRLLKLAFLQDRQVERGWLEVVAAHQNRLIEVERVEPTGWCEEVEMQVRNLRPSTVMLKLEQGSFFEYSRWNEQRLLLTTETSRIVLLPTESKHVRIKTACVNDRGLDPRDSLHLTPFRLEVEEALQRDEASLRAFLLNSTALVAHMAGATSFPAPAADWWNFVARSPSLLREVEECVGNISLPRCSQLRRSFALAPHVDELRGSRRLSPLMQAAQDCQVEEMKSLRQIFHASLQTRDTVNRSALHHAVASSCFEGAAFLLESGSEIDLQDSLGLTALMVAIRSHLVHPNLVLLLASAGSSPFMVDKSDQSAIWWSSWRGNATTVRLLLSLWCPSRSCHLLLACKNRYGRTPLAQASAMGHSEVVEVLREYGAEDEEVEEEVDLEAAKQGTTRKERREEEEEGV